MSLKSLGSFGLGLFMVASDLVVALAEGGAFFVAYGLQDGVFAKAVLDF